MSSKTQTKTEIRNNTAKIGKLLRGIDNDTLAIKRDQAKLNDRVKSVQDSAKTVQTLVGGISNMALAAPVAKVQIKPDLKKPVKAVKPAKVAKAVKPAKAAKPAKPAKPAKVAKAVKVAKVAKVAKAAKPAKAAKSAEKAPKQEPSSNRPSLKKVISEIIMKNSSPMGAADIYKTACQKFGYWSRQSLYNALKDNKFFAKKGEVYDVVDSAPLDTSDTSDTSDSEAEKFVQKVEGNAATSAVV